MASLINAFDPRDALDRPSASLLNRAPPLAIDAAQAPTPADAALFNAQAAGDWIAQQRAISEQRGLWANGAPTAAGARQAGMQAAGALAMATTAPESGPLRLAKTEVIPGETDSGAQYDVHVNPGPARLGKLLDESGGAVRVSPGVSDVAVADAAKATHFDIEQALMDSDHPMLGQMDPEGSERLGWFLRGSKGDPAAGDIRVGGWNVRVQDANNGPAVPPSEWPAGLLRAVGLKSQ